MSASTEARVDQVGQSVEESAGSVTCSAVTLQMQHCLTPLGLLLPLVCGGLGTRDYVVPRNLHITPTEVGNGGSEFEKHQSKKWKKGKERIKGLKGGKREQVRRVLGRGGVANYDLKFSY